MSSILLIIASLIVFPFLVYYLTSKAFFRTSNNKTGSKEPPAIPYFVPGVFNTAGFAQLGARRYFAELIKDYGTFAPFKVRAGPRSYIVLRDPIHIRRVLEADDHLTARAARVETFDKLFGLPNADGHAYQSEVKEHSQADSISSDESHFFVPDTALASSADAFILNLSASMHDKMFQYDTWTGIEDLWSFLQLVLVRCIIDTLFGPALLKQYPRMVRDYLDFNAAAESFIPGMPRMMMSGAAKARDRLLQGMKKWAQDNSEALNAESPVCGGQAASSVIWEHIRKVIGPGEHGLRSTVAEMLSVTHVTTSEVLTSTFWATIETLRKSHSTRDMTAAITQHLSPITHKYDVLQLSQEPFVNSLQTEVRRLRTASCVIRTNRTDGFPLDKQWSLPKGATVIMFSNDVGLNTEAWKKAQPRLVEKSLEEFWPERFITPEKKGRYKRAGVESSKSDAGDLLKDLVTELTACDQFPGSRFISALQTATLAVLFAEFEIELSDVDNLDTVLPLMREFAFGTVKPLEKVAVHIRKRRT